MAERRDVLLLYLNGNSYSYVSLLENGRHLEARKKGKGNDESYLGFIVAVCECCARNPQPTGGGPGDCREVGLSEVVSPWQGEKKCLIQCLNAYALFLPPVSGSVIRRVCSLGAN